jgi:DNA-directed RNA polymerase subunit RPC12/RpoP
MATEDDEYRCSVCGETFDSEASVERHLKDQGILW